MSELLDGPFDLMTLEQWDALEIAHARRWELSEGKLIMSPRPQLIHQEISKRFTRLLDDHLPDDLEALPEIEVTTPMLRSSSRSSRPAHSAWTTS